MLERDKFFNERWSDINGMSAIFDIITISFKIAKDNHFLQIRIINS